MHSYKYITTATTTAFAGNEITKVVIHGIFINKTTTGTVTLKTGSTTIGIFAASTAPGTYWKSEKGVYVEDFKITNASSEDITVEYSNI